MATDHDGVEARYATWRMMEEGERRAGTLGIAELVRFLEEPAFVLSAAETASLFANPDLRATWLALKARRAIGDMPSVAAASDGDVLDRVFSGGRMRMTPSGTGPLLYLLVTFEADTIPRTPTLLVVETPGGAVAKLGLAVPDEAGEVFVILDPRRAGDAALAAALRNPLSTGNLLEADPEA